MEATVVSVGKSVLDGALSYAKSAVAEEVALQLGVQRDRAFITEELEMMQAFLMAAHDERDHSKVVKIWVKQVRDVSYDVEDCLQDFVVRLGRPPSYCCWLIPRMMLRQRRRIGKQMKELRARVEDVSQRNLRYNLVSRGAGSKPALASAQPTIAGAEMSAVDESRRQSEIAKVLLVQMVVNKKDYGLGVTAVWGGSGDLQETTSIITRAYQDLNKKFECHAWIRLTRPFNPTKFMQSIVRQFFVNYLREARERGGDEESTIGGQILSRMGMMRRDHLADEFKGYLNDKSYLIVLDDLSSIEEWDCITTCFPPDNKKGSRIIVSTQLAEVASLCVGREDVAPEHKLLSDDHTIYAFCRKVCQDRLQPNITEITEVSSPNASATSSNSCAGKTSLTRAETMVAAFKESQLIGRGKDISDIIQAITSEDSKRLEVISVWGMGGLGKTALVRDVYRSQELIGKFERRACVSIMRPFKCGDLLRSLAIQIDKINSEEKAEKAKETAEKKEGRTEHEEGSTEQKEGRTEQKVVQLPLDGLKGKKYLIVLDDLLFSTEWDAIRQHFPETGKASRIIVTTRLENIAKHCSDKQDNIYKLQSLQHNDARDLFMRKVFGRIIDMDEKYPELVEQASLILKKCNGLPLAIVTIGGFLANHPVAVLEWKKFNDHIRAELEMNPKLEFLMAALRKSYDGLPYHLKSCFLYLSIFPEDHKTGRRRLVLRWVAEGYSREIHDKSAEEIAESYFMDLISRSMILPSQQSVHSRKGIDSCQVHDLIREISISNAMEENLVLRLEEGCSLKTQGITRHLSISNSWEGDEIEFESTVDLSRVRSITVFGQWRSFFISDKMRLLRVLDMEGASGVVDHHLVHIGKHIHLKYLSLRGCNGISHLPGSLGNLKQLQTLDIRGTRIVKLPKSIVNLRSLNYLRGGRKPMEEDFTRGLEYMMCLPYYLVLLCLFWCVPQASDTPGMNRRDICTYFCCGLFPVTAMRLDRYGVVVPRGMRKLKAMHTLGVVNISRGKAAILRDIKGLTRLRKLGVTGINKGNGKELCFAVAALSSLESLSMRSDVAPGLRGCGADGMSSLPRNLQSLKLSGNLVDTPVWMSHLHNLVKLKLRNTRIPDVAGTFEVLGELPNLAIFRLLEDSFQGQDLGFVFKRGSFPSLVVLDLNLLYNNKSVKFERGATPVLELLRVGGRTHTDGLLFSGLKFLLRLREVLLKKASYNGIDSNEKVVKGLRKQLARNTNRPVLKME